MKKWIKGSIAAFAMVCLFALPTMAAADASPRNNEKADKKSQERRNHDEKRHEETRHGKMHREDGYYEEHHVFNNHCAVEEPCYRTTTDCGTSCNPCNWNFDFKPSNFSFISSSLFWSTCTNNTDFAVTAEDFDSDGPFLEDAKVQSLNPEFDYGFRFTGVYQFPCDCWELRFSWTHFNPSDSGRLTDEDDFVFISNGSDNSNIREVSFVHAHYELDYDTFDITLGKECCLCDKFTIRPYGGARFLWMDQKFHINFFGGDFNDTEGFESENEWDADYSAGGIIGGIEGFVDIGCDFYLWGNFSASAVAGRADIDQEVLIFAIDEPTVDVQYGDSPECIISTNFEAAMGIGYRFMCGCFDMDWRISYEFVTWNNVPEFNNFRDDLYIDSTTGGKHGSVGFHGVTLTSTTRF